MKCIGFATCSDLSRYFPSKENPLLTHDDYLAFLHLKQLGYKVSPVVWTDSFKSLQAKNLDVLVIRSPWDYSDSKETRQEFIGWLEKLKTLDLKVLNPVDLMLWNFDKHYLSDMEKVGVDVVPSFFVKPEDKVDLLEMWKKFGPFVVKPCVSAGAKDTYRVLSYGAAVDLREGKGDYPVAFDDLRKERFFMVQPYLSSVEDFGEWSLVFLDGEYSHSLLKKPKKGSWFVQDELGGSVHWLTPPKSVELAAQKSFKLIKKAYQIKNSEVPLVDEITYARVDIIVYKDKCYLGELEMIEPELFFLDRSSAEHKPHKKALDLFSRSVAKSCS